MYPVPEFIIQVLVFFDSLKWYHYLGLLVIFAIIFGKKKMLDFEAKLFADGSNEISGELEIEKFDKEGLTAKLRLDAISQFYGKEAEIFINNQLVSQFKLEENGTRVEILHPILPTGKTSLFIDSNTRKWNRVNLPLAEDVKVINNQRVEIKHNSKLFAHGILLKD